MQSSYQCAPYPESIRLNIWATRFQHHPQSKGRQIKSSRPFIVHNEVLCL